MATLPKQFPPLWDREFDHAGRPIRRDVRAAAHEIWKPACRRARSLLGHDADAGAMMEIAIAKVSHYLDRNQVPPSSTKVAPFLMRAFSWQVRSRYLLEQRVETVADLEKVAEKAAISDSIEAMNRRLDLDKVLRLLSPRGSRILLLRLADRSWKEIAKQLDVPESTARNSFWREIRQIQILLKLNV
jgi:RNA polymerase sigma factor (sigma-70 family)